MSTETCQSICSSATGEVYCSRTKGHDGRHSDGKGWEW